MHSPCNLCNLGNRGVAQAQPTIKREILVGLIAALGAGVLVFLVQYCFESHRNVVEVKSGVIRKLAATRGGATTPPVIESKPAFIEALNEATVVFADSPEVI